MVRRSAFAASVVLSLCAILVVSGSIHASGCTWQREGEVWLPYGPTPPPAVGDLDLHVLLYYVLVDVQPGPFRLQATGSNDPAFCHGGGTCIFLPDFNVAFYEESGLLHDELAVYDDLGPVEGVVPPGADFALVWMNTGLGVPILEQLDGAFVFLQGCA